MKSPIAQINRDNLLIKSAILLKNLCLFVFICGFIIPAIFAQETLSPQNLHQWGAISLFHGLPSDRVRAITQDQAGILWFGTDNGLAKYDGRRVQTVTAEGLPQEKILALKSLEDGSIWIGTENGAVRLKDGKFQLLDETKNDAITSIYFNQNVFLSTENGLIFSFSESADNSLKIEKISNQILMESDGKPLKITSLAQLDGKLVAGTLSRSILILENNQFSENFSRPRPFFVNALEQDKNGNLWLGAKADESGSGLFLLKDLANPTKIGEGIGNVSALRIDTKGDIWVGTEKGGIYHFRGERQLEHFTFENTAGGLRSNTVFSLLIDREGVIWCGTDKGISRFDPNSPFNQTISEDSNSNFVRAIFQTKDGKILAGTNRGLFAFENEINNWKLIESFAKKSVYSISEDISGKLLVGTSNGFYQNVDLQSQKLETTDSAKDANDNVNKDTKDVSSVRATINFQGKTYLAFFGRGFARLDDAPTILFPENPNLRDVMSLYAEDDKTLWIGTTRNGVFKFDGKVISQENALETLRGAVVRNIDGTKESGIWFATDKGIFVFRNNELQLVSNEQNVRQFSVFGNEIWGAADGGGLLHIKPDENFGWLISNLNVEQGLSSQKTFAVLPVRNADNSESLLIGTNRGIVRYQPNLTAPLLIPTRILSQRLHTSEELQQTINLDYPQNSLALEVAGLSSRTFPEQFQYTFLLRDSKENIIQKKLSNDPQFLMENLKPDTYSVEVRAFNQDLLTSAPLKFSFKIGKSPFPWVSTALAVLLVIAVIALVWATMERYQIIRKNREIKKARFDLANEAERERKRIASDLHDQTLADLRNLMLMSDKMPNVESNFRTEIESVSNEIRRICEDLSPSVLENIGLTASLEFLLSNTIEHCKFLCEESLEERLNFTPNVQMQIYRIVQEILNNIKRHARANLVEMKITDSIEEGFTLTIENDGQEFEPENKTQTGRGLSNIKSRANLIEAEISWQKRENGGMAFLLSKK